MIIQGWSGNINSVGDLFKSAAVGAISGAASAVVGVGVAGALNIGGFAGAAITGAATGFTGGFASGAGNAWVGGESFGSGLTFGLKTGAIGGVTGGILGGFIGGIDAVNNDASFWTGEYKGEVGGLSKTKWSAEFLDEEVPAGVKPTKTGDIAFTDENLSYGEYGLTRNGGTKPHYGVDYSGEIGDDVYSLYDGRVARIWDSKAYGPHATRISSTLNGKSYYVDYGHLSGTAVSEGQRLLAGDLVGFMGRMGSLAGTSFPTHVHIAIWRPLPGNIMGFIRPWWQ